VAPRFQILVPIFYFIKLGFTNVMDGIQSHNNNNAPNCELRNNKIKVAIGLTDMKESWRRLPGELVIVQTHSTLGG